MGSKTCDLPVICPWGAFAFQEAKIALGLLGALGLRSIGPLDPEDVLGAELGVGLNTGTASGGISPMNRQKLPLEFAKCCVQSPTADPKHTPGPCSRARTCYILSKQAT